MIIDNKENFMPVTQLSQLDLNKTYTVLDYLSWQMEEMVELIKGKIYKMSPAPKSSHQLIVSNFIFSLRSLKKQYQHSCKVCVSPFDVYLKGIGNTETTVVQPDICIVCDTNKIEERGCLGAPSLIIEILNPSTLTKDVNIKYHLYEENGVKEYWIVNPKEKQVLTFVLDENKQEYVKTGNFLEESNIPINIWNGETVAWADVFEDL